MAALALHDALADPDLGDELEPREHRPHERHPAVGLREEQARDDQISGEPQQLLARVADTGPQRAAQRARLELGVVHSVFRRERAASRVASVAAMAMKSAHANGPATHQAALGQVARDEPREQRERPQGASAGFFEREAHGARERQGVRHAKCRQADDSQVEREIDEAVVSGPRMKLQCAIDFEARRGDAPEGAGAVAEPEMFADRRDEQRPDLRAPRERDVAPDQREQRRRHGERDRGERSERHPDEDRRAHARGRRDAPQRTLRAATGTAARASAVAPPAERAGTNSASASAAAPPAQTRAEGFAHASSPHASTPIASMRANVFLWPRSPLQAPGCTVRMTRELGSQREPGARSPR